MINTTKLKQYNYYSLFISQGAPLLEERGAPKAGVR